MREQVYSLQSAADSSLAERTGFIRRTYLHVAGAIAALALLEVFIFQSGLDKPIIALMFGSQYSWLIVLGRSTIRLEIMPEALRANCIRHWKLSRFSKFISILQKIISVDQSTVDHAANQGLHVFGQLQIVALVIGIVEL